MAERTGIPNDIRMINLLEELVQNSKEAEKRIPAQTAALVADKITAVNGVVLPSRAMVQEILMPVLSVMEKIAIRLFELEKQVLELSARLDDVSKNVNTSKTVDTNDENPRYRTFFWDGEHHFFPKDFKLHAVPSVTLWRLWLFGDVNTVNMPYRYLNGKNMNKAQRAQLCRARAVMDRVRESIGKTYSELTAEGMTEAVKQFLEHYSILMGSFKRHANMSFATAYKHLKIIPSKSTDDQVDTDAGSGSDTN